ncbi:MAG TPA: OB-fold domain-containing protein [Acidimicrobiales bacterium]
MNKPAPVPDDVSRHYWEGARQGALLLQRCTACRFYLHPPGVACPRCLSESLDVVPACGWGTIYAFTVARQAFDPAFADDLPYVLALVELDDQPGLRMVTNIIDSELSEITAGAPVEATFEQRGEWSIPQFRLAPRPAR